MVTHLRKNKEYFYSRWVDQCDGAHDHNRRIERFEVGQNWAMLAGSYLGTQAIGLSGSQMVQNWYDEVSHEKNLNTQYNILTLK